MSDLPMTTPQTLLALIREAAFLGLDDVTLNGLAHFSFTWDDGYYRYKIQNHGEGSMGGAHSYHPNVVCEGNPCEFCGHYLLDALVDGGTHERPDYSEDARA